jgi:DNA modification methylase
MRNVFTECFRVLKKEGVCFVNISNCKDNQFKAYDLAFLLRDIGFILIDSIIWYKQSPRYLNTNRMLTNSYEFIFMFTKSENYSIDKLSIGLPCKTKKGLKCRTNVWVFDRIFRNDFSGFKHVAMFPEKLPELCIKLCSKKGDVVVDPFMGAGTTAVSAKKLGRQYIGYDVSKEYVEMAKLRIKNTRGVEHEKDIANNSIGVNTFNANC